MQIKEITVSYGVTLNAGNYNSVRVDGSITAVLEDGENPEICREQLLADLKETMRAEARELAKKPKAQVAECLMGLPVDVANSLQ